MTFSERMMELVDQGMAASKEFAVKAGAKAQDLGERGVLMLEIKQLENRAQKLFIRLGNEVYKLIAEQNLNSIDRDTPEIKTILEELANIREAIELKEAELRNRKG